MPHAGTPTAIASESKRFTTWWCFVCFQNSALVHKTVGASEQKSIDVGGELPFANSRPSSHIVPCGDGDILVKDLIREATLRYKKATGKVTRYFETYVDKNLN
ncbi:unnamed protein product [Phyllotreta striolata]|uniref:Par3/HAL N-terminal domain-containing protein n=1 Tax=Phyllotreta striolata TaxID=444603 RepID=A0A9N9TTE7_PHYSR|nr:unnamed protein product [Phyllotreta striolata]